MLSFVNAAGAIESVNSTSHAITVPTGVQVGDLLVLTAEVGSTSGTTLNAPAGWNTIDGNHDMAGSTAPSASVYYKIATASEVAGSTVTWTTSGAGASTKGTTGIVAWRGVDPVTPFVGFAVGIQATATTSHPVDASALTVTNPNSLAVFIALTTFGSGSGNNTDPPSGLTEVFDSLPNTGNGVEVSTESVGAGAALGTLTATTGNTARSIDYVIVFNALAVSPARPQINAMQAVQRAAVM